MDRFSRGQVAKSTNLSIETIRFYEKQGLIKDPPRSPNGYRQYSQEDISRLKFIKRAKELGFSLKEITELLNLNQDAVKNRLEVQARAQAKLNEIEDKIADLKRIKQALAKLSSCCNQKTNLDNCPILEALES